MKILEISGRSPYANFFCPFCGEQISDADGEDLGECPHLIAAYM